jgi:hypothetical protein
LYGSIHRCVDFLLLARVILVSFFQAIFGVFCGSLDSSIEGVPVRISLRGSWVDDLCIFVCDLDPSNARFVL